MDESYEINDWTPAQIAAAEERWARDHYLPDDDGPCDCSAYCRVRYPMDHMPDCICDECAMPF